MGRWWGERTSLAAVMLLMLVQLPACGLDNKKHPDPADDTGDFAADRLGSDEDSFFNDLDPAERGALERSGIASPRSADDDGKSAPDSQDDPQSKSEKASGIAMSVLSVAMTVGAAVAPFLLF